jgi:hypothetical protein
MTPGNRQQLAKQLQMDLRFWLLMLGVQSALRAVFIRALSGRIHESSSASEILMTLANGLRYDAVIATCFLLPTLICSLLCGRYALTGLCERLRLVAAGGFCITAAMIWLVSIPYFREYNDIFNHFIFGLIYDDFGAVAKTILSSYHPIPVILLVLAIGGVGMLAQWATSRLPMLSEPTVNRLFKTRVRRLTVGLLSVSFFVIGARGSLGRRPVQRKDAAISADAFLNKAVLNPFTTLRYAFKDHKTLNSDSGLEQFFPDEDIHAALSLVTGVDAQHESISDYLAKSASGAPGATSSSCSWKATRPGRFLRSSQI